MAAALKIPAYFIKKLCRWEINTYHVYIRTLKESDSCIQADIRRRRYTEWITDNSQVSSGAYVIVAMF